jgi:GntR family transcriptional regulator, uxu operon transcriptional repressor
VPLTTVEPTRLYRQIADQIATLIDRGEFIVGARLPAERELASVLGVSRTSVREAIICLELAGRVEVRVGTGIFVCAAPKPEAAATTNADGDAPGPFDLLAARQVIEGEIAALAARKIRRREIAVLHETMARMRASDADHVPRETADREFHVAIAQATGNSALRAVVNRLWDARSHPLWTRIEAHFHTPALRARTLEDHAAIVAALEAHDPDAARVAMHRHLARVIREFQRQVEGPGAPPGPASRKTATTRALRRNHEGGVTS